MEENEQLEHAGNEVAGNDKKQNVNPGPDKEDASLASDGPVSESKGDDTKPDLNDIKKNPDPEPGVPDQDF